MFCMSVSVWNKVLLFREQPVKRIGTKYVGTRLLFTLIYKPVYKGKTGKIWENQLKFLELIWYNTSRKM